MTLGSVHYFSPEQARGESATAASDIFSLGIVLFEMLTGVRPWEGDSAASVALARLTGPTPDPAILRPSVPPELSSITRRALARDPIDRYASAGMMADALDGWLAASGRHGDRGRCRGRAAGAAAARRALPARPWRGGRLPIEVTDRGVGHGPPEPDGRPVRPGRLRDGRRRRRRRQDIDRPGRGAIVDEDKGTSPLVWVAGILAIALLAAIAFLVFQLLSGNRTAARHPGRGPQLRRDAGERRCDRRPRPRPHARPDRPGVGQAGRDDPRRRIPAAGRRSTREVPIKVTVAAAAGTVPVPDLKNKIESEALQSSGRCGAQARRPERGVRPDGADRDSSSGQSPPAGIVVAKGTRGRLGRLEGS